MTIHFISLILIWLLPLTVSSTLTSDQDNNFTNVMTTTQVTPNKFTHDQLRTQEASSLNIGPNITQSIIVDANPTEEKSTKPSAKPTVQTTLTTHTETFSKGTQTAATPTTSTLPQLNSSTVGIKSITETQSEVATSATTVVTSHTRIPTWVPSMQSSSTQSQFTNATITRPFKRPTLSTNITSATTTSTKRVDHKSTSTSSVTGDNASQATGLYKTSKATTKSPFIHITTAMERQDPPEKSNKGTNHGKVVAGLIGGALLLMMVGFLVIYIKKRKLQRQQLTARDWAGPSPFLEGGADNGQVTLRSSNRISFSSFLPQRLSKRLSLLPDTDTELEDMTHATTFGNTQVSTSGQDVDGNDVQGSNGTAVVVPEMKNTGDAPETVENSVSVVSSQVSDPL